jgi:chromosome segregation ATPase
MVVCNRCEHTFVVRGTDVLSTDDRHGTIRQGEADGGEALEAARARLAELQREFGRLAGRYLDARNNLARAQLRLAELEQERDAARDAREAIAREAEEIQARFLAIEAEQRPSRAEFEARIGTLSDERDRLATFVFVLASERDQVRDERIQAARREQELSRRIDALVQQLGSHSDEVPEADGDLLGLLERDLGLDPWEAAAASEGAFPFDSR